MTSILDLSDKTLNNLLRYTDVSIEDVINLSLTCKQLQLRIRDEEVWRYKFFQRWPLLKCVCDVKWKKGNLNVKTEVLRRLKCRSILLNYIESLYVRYHDRDILTAKDLKDFVVMFSKKDGAHFMNAYYLEDELSNIVNLNLTHEGTNLRIVYYSDKLFFHMRHYRFKQKWHKFKSQPPQQQVLDKVLIMLLQYSQFVMYVSKETVMHLMDTLAYNALAFVLEIFPHHSLSRVSTAQLDFWKCNNLENNYWNPLEARLVLNAVNVVIYETRKHHVRHQSSGTVRDLNTILTLFSESEQILWYLAIFHAVARRLGVRCDLKYFNDDRHFLIWKANYKSKSIIGNCYLIDVTDGHIRGSGLHRSKFNANVFSEHTIITPLQLMVSLSKCFQFYGCSGMQINNVLPANDNNLIMRQNVNLVLQYAHSIEHCNMDFSEVLDMLNIQLQRLNLTKDQKSEIRVLLKKLSQPKPQFPIIVHTRTENVKYAVGMIMECMVNKSHSTAGVILGWDAICSENQVFRNDEGQLYRINPIHRASINYKQPFYKILTANQDCIYMPQDMVKPMINTIFIHHSEIGRFFCYFKRTYYVPNSMLEMQYPYDEEVRDRWHAFLAWRRRIRYYGDKFFKEGERCY